MPISIFKVCNRLFSIIIITLAAVKCSPVTPRLGGVNNGFWLMGKLDRAWVGEWVHGVVRMWWWWGGGLKVHTARSSFNMRTGHRNRSKSRSSIQ